jgi:hypothetical protein
VSLKCQLCDAEFDGRNVAARFRSHLIEHGIHPSLIEEGLQLAIDREALGADRHETSDREAFHD